MKGYHMDIYVFSDESGVFDKSQNDYYAFGGLIVVGKANKDTLERKYLKAERTVRDAGHYTGEIKATKIDYSERDSLFRALNDCYKFSVIIDLHALHEKTFSDKKTKQRYLDYAYKVGVKKALIEMLNKGLIIDKAPFNIKFFIDEHSTATNGLYELKEALEQEFKHGTINYRYQRYYPPIFNNLQSVQVRYCDSSTVTLVRAADIIANKVFRYSEPTRRISLYTKSNLCIHTEPQTH